MRLISVQFNVEVQLPNGSGRKGVNNTRNPNEAQQPAIQHELHFEPDRRCVRVEHVPSRAWTLVPLENVVQMTPDTEMQAGVMKPPRGGAVKAAERLEQGA